MSRVGKAVAIDKAGISKDALNDAMGLYVFFYSFVHYAFQMLDKKDIADMTTSSSLTEFQKQLGTLSSGDETSPAKATP